MNTRNDYLSWLSSRVASVNAPYKKLLAALNSIPFEWSIPMDENRAIDGLDLRKNYISAIEGPATVLEVLVALSIRMENIMDDATFGDRVPYWFSIMISNMGLASQDDKHFNPAVTNELVRRFMNREYGYFGENGGLFVVMHPLSDMKNVDIWMQAMWFLREYAEGER